MWACGYRQELFDQITERSPLRRRGVQGRFCEVTVGGHKYGQKTTKISHSALCHQFATEVRLLQLLNDAGGHPNVVHLVAAMEDHEAIQGIMLTPLADGTFATLPPSSWETGFAQIIRGLRFLEEHRVVHRDVKPANVLVHRENGGAHRACLADFGVATTLASAAERCTDQVGTAVYLSPPRARGEPYAYEADRWSVGVMVAQAVQYDGVFDRIPCADTVDSKIGLLLYVANGGLEQHVHRLLDRQERGGAARRLMDMAVACMGLHDRRTPSCGSRKRGTADVRLPASRRRVR